MADELSEKILPYAIVYPTKTEPTGLSKNDGRRVATQMHCEGDSNSH
jgi:hypothetical protein